MSTASSKLMLQTLRPGLPPPPNCPSPLRYYSLEVSYFKSSLDSHLLDLLWNKYWVNTLSSCSLLTVSRCLSWPHPHAYPLCPSLCRMQTIPHSKSLTFHRSWSELSTWYGISLILELDIKIVWNRMTRMSYALTFRLALVGLERESLGGETADSARPLKTGEAHTSSQISLSPHPPPSLFPPSPLLPTTAPKPPLKSCMVLWDKFLKTNSLTFLLVLRKCNTITVMIDDSSYFCDVLCASHVMYTL